MFMCWVMQYNLNVKFKKQGRQSSGSQTYLQVKMLKSPDLKRIILKSMIHE